VVYTVVSRGRVLGTTELEFKYRKDRFRCGNFWPASGVEPLIEIAIGVSPALFAANSASPFDPLDDHDSRARAADLARRNPTTEDADLASAFDRLEALELELRGPNGEVIETETIGLRDTEFLATVADAEIEREMNLVFGDDPELSFEDLIEFDREPLDENDDWADDVDPDWVDESETPFSRYQVCLRLANDGDVP
jgi:hypothetical protein